MREPFPGTLEGRPFGAFALRLGAARGAAPRDRLDRARRGRHAVRARTAVVRRRSYELEYELETSSGYVTERLHVSVAGGPELTLVRGQSPELDGALDCDLGFSPLTNAMPVLRDPQGRRRGAHRSTSPWVSVPDLTVHRDHQIYEPLDGDRVRFCSPEADFERVIQLTPDGFVRDYPGIARLVGDDRARS